ncbi:MAG: hypothetical protein LBC84_03530 [Prevotellaceae bacterium]|jgi:hypothetical protein|nr:hypothetical protein [Prevotellaceae bacterium]
MSERDCKELREKVINGINLAFARLLQEKQRDDRYLVISRYGRQIEQVKAAELFPYIQSQ